MFTHAFLTPEKNFSLFLGHGRQNRAIVMEEILFLVLQGIPILSAVPRSEIAVPSAFPLTPP
jgi:hypothetical protein